MGALLVGGCAEVGVRKGDHAGAEMLCTALARISGTFAIPTFINALHELIVIHILQVKAASAYIDMDLSSSSFLRQAIPDSLMDQQKHSLVSIFPDLRDNIMSLSAPHVIYVKSVLILEQTRGKVYIIMLRRYPQIGNKTWCAAACGTLKAVMHYLEDGALEREGLTTLISAICDLCFRQFCSTMTKQADSAGQPLVLLDHCLFLLAQCAHRYIRVRTAAFRYLVDLLDKFPQLLWNTSW